MKTWLCIENGEEFTVQAKTRAEADAAAAIYGGYVVRELK